MKNLPTPRCVVCETKSCRHAKDCFGEADGHQALYEHERVGRVHKAASAIEARHYCKEPRLGEVILFARELGCRRVGLAFCVGLSDEAKVIEQIRSEHFDVVSVCCEVSGIEKETLDLEQIKSDGSEVMCDGRCWEMTEHRLHFGNASPFNTLEGMRNNGRSSVPRRYQK